MARVIPVGQPVNDAERAAIAALRDRLPDSYTLTHNFEIERHGERFEIDIALVAPHAVYLIDAKGTRGNIDVIGPKWYPEARAPYPSPLLKLRSHARSVKGLITDQHPGRPELEGIYVDASIILTSTDASLTDPNGKDGPSVVNLKDVARFFQDTTRVPQRFAKNIGQFHRLILHAIDAVAKPASKLRFGHWEVRERLGASDAYTEYRAENVVGGGTARLRVYRADPYLPEEARNSQAVRIANAYRALSKLPFHPNIVAARDFFEAEEDASFVLVLEDAPGQALSVHLTRPQLALTIDQKWRVTKDLLSALGHAHRHGVIHRNLTPGAILVGEDGATRITDFDFARAGEDRTLTIADSIVDLIEQAYVAPEAYRAPEAATAASDIFSAGLILYELFAGEKPFSGDPSEVWDQNGVFPVAPSSVRPELNVSFDSWLQALCEFDPALRPSAESSLSSLSALLEGSREQAEGRDAEPDVVDTPSVEADYRDLPPGYQLTHKFIVEKRLGKPGSFGVVYKVIDTLGDVARTVKLIISDRHSTLERLKQEYRQLVHLPEHPYVVRVLDADLIQGSNTPFLVFEYVEGSDVADMITGRLFAPEDALILGRQVIDGLVHLHSHGVHHCDIKPRNLLWTAQGARIIDFNVSVKAGDSKGRGGGSRKYLPPDFDLDGVPQNGSRTDRDLYALGLTLYEATTSRYPWDSSEPHPNQAAPDPRELSGNEDLSQEFVAVVLKAIAPKRADRFQSALEFKDALDAVTHAKRPPRVRAPEGPSVAGQVSGDNTNPFVDHLLTLYSQSSRSNAGTRGIDLSRYNVYVPTGLDRELLPAVIDGEFKLVIITGNAGDGKTAFLQRLEVEVEERGGSVDRTLPNGSSLHLDGHKLWINYDGSQDEGAKENTEVLRQFLAPFAGDGVTRSDRTETRLIAINEGRLVDFLAECEGEFPQLSRIVKRCLEGQQSEAGVTVVNLNLRSVVAPSQGGSILKRTMLRMVEPALWEACESCTLRDRCYAVHNARSFQDQTAGPKILDRLEFLYTLTHLRGRMHVTMRDLRSALSYLLISDRSCKQIHDLYQAGSHQEIARSFYFNSWMGGRAGSADRLLSLLGEIDIGLQDDPRLDRGFDFLEPRDGGAFRFDSRGKYDLDVLSRLFEDLPRSGADTSIIDRSTAHRGYVSMARRRHFFERRDSGWQDMVPYRSAQLMADVAQGKTRVEPLLPELLHAINRGEGLQSVERLDGSLALQLRNIENGTVRSYRLFDLADFRLRLQDLAARARFVEHLPSGLLLRYEGGGAQATPSELIINLDVFEMLMRLNEGYRPSVEELQGYYLSLSVFKNSLNALPYREILLTTTGHDFYRLGRMQDGNIELRAVKETV